MKKKREIILIGGGGHCKACIDVIESTKQHEIKGIIDVPDKIGQSILGYPIIDSDENLGKIVKRFENFLITVGHIKSPDLRIKIFETIKRLGGHFPAIISPKAHVSRFAEIGAGTIVMHGVVVNADAKIGINTIVNNLALIEHDVVIGNNVHISTGARVNGNAIVGDNCFIGSGTVINQNVKIAHNVIVGSGSLVRKNIMVPGIYAGNPLKKYK